MACHEAQVLVVGNLCSSLDKVEHGSKCERCHALWITLSKIRYVLVFWFWCALLHFKYIGGWGGAYSIFTIVFLAITHLKVYIHSSGPSYRYIPSLKKKNLHPLSLNIHSFIHSSIQQSINHILLSIVHVFQVLPGAYCTGLLNHVLKAAGSPRDSLDVLENLLSRETQPPLTGAIFDESVWRTRTLY